MIVKSKGSMLSLNRKVPSAVARRETLFASKQQYAQRPQVFKPPVKNFACATAPTILGRCPRDA